MPMGEWLDYMWSRSDWVLEDNTQKFCLLICSELVIFIIDQ